MDIFLHPPCRPGHLGLVRWIVLIHGLASCPARAGLVSSAGYHRTPDSLRGGSWRKPWVRVRPEIFNTDQGSQFTSEAFTQTLQEQRVQVSMDGKGRYLDNIFVERLWRSIKYEEVYLKAYQTVAEARTGINAYLEFYNRQRPHQALGYRTPAEVYQHGQEERGAAAEKQGCHRAW